MHCETIIYLLIIGILTLILVEWLVTLKLDTNWRPTTATGSQRQPLIIIFFLYFVQVTREWLVTLKLGINGQLTTATGSQRQPLNIIFFIYFEQANREWLVTL
jgi:hypothetical protein